MAEKWHSGISMHKLSVGPGFVGVVFAVGCSLVFVIGLPALWSFVAFSAALGLGIALLLRLINRRRSERMKPLSILQTDERAKTPIVQEQPGHRNYFHAQPVSPQPAV